MDESFTVSQLARRVGTSGDTIRYYERIGLLSAARRSQAGYRLFGDEAVDRVAFVKRAQRSGLQLDAVRELLEVRDRGLCACGHARTLLATKLSEIDNQMTALRRLRDDIVELADGMSDDADGRWPCGEQLLQIQTEERVRQ